MNRDFEEWYEDNFLPAPPFKAEYSKGCLEYVWNHQQERIDAHYKEMVRLQNCNCEWSITVDKVKQENEVMKLFIQDMLDGGVILPDDDYKRLKKYLREEDSND